MSKNNLVSGGRSTARYIKASNLFVDPEDVVKDWQRDPSQRKFKLAKIFGKKGEKFSLEKAGALIVHERSNGMFAIKDGGGRWYAVMHMANKPNQELLCVVQENTKDLEAFQAANTVTPISPGKLFMARGNDPAFKYESRVCNVLKDLGLTAEPGHGAKSVKINPVIFAYDLGVLKTSLSLAKEFWSKAGARIEGIGLVGLAGFLFLYGDVYGKNPQFNMERLRDILRSVPYEDLKQSARAFLPKNKEHQRQWGAAMAKEFVTRYNNYLMKDKLVTRRIPRLNLDKLATLQEKVQDYDNYKIFCQVWEMRKVVK